MTGETETAPARQLEPLLDMRGVGAPGEILPRILLPLFVRSSFRSALARRTRWGGDRETFAVYQGRQRRHAGPKASSGRSAVQRRARLACCSRAVTRMERALRAPTDDGQAQEARRFQGDRLPFLHL